MSDRLNSALDWATTRQPVSVCRACRFPCVGHMNSNHCPTCGQQSVLDPRDGMMKMWNKLHRWAPLGCLVVAGEKIGI